VARLERQPGVNETIIKRPLAKKVLATDHFWREAAVRRLLDLRGFDVPR
jgi:hypothetical protein